MVLSITSSIPVVAKVSEDSIITITGTDFSAPAIITIDPGIADLLATNIVVNSATKITCTVPGSLVKGSYTIRVNVLSVDVDLANGFLVVPAFPVPPFATEDFATIQTRVMQRLPAGSDSREGSTYYNLLAPFSLELADMYARLNTILNLALATKTTGVYLDYKAVEFGITRNLKLKATGIITFTGIDTTVVPVGTTVSTTATGGASPIQFTTDVEGTVSGTTVDIAVTAVLAGSQGNVAATTINSLETVITNITGISNVAATANGIDEELDEPFRSRLLRRAQQPSHGGNIGDYIIWAKEADINVGKVGVDPLAGGNGTVTVVFLTKTNAIPSAALITTVQDYIAPTPADEGGGKAPIGADVTVAAATIVNVNVVVTVAVLPGFTSANVLADVKTAIDDFLDDLEIGGDVLYHALSSAIVAVIGVNTISAYTVNTGVVDVSLADTAKADSGTITVT